MTKKCLLLFVCFLLFFFAEVVRGQSDPKSITVYVWLSAECPLSQKYTYTLKKVYDQFEGKKIRFVAVFPSDKALDIKEFRKTYQFHWETISDSKKKITNAYSATITPEVVVLDDGGKIAYRGAIDDQAAELGKFRPEARNHYLLDALKYLEQNKPIELSETKPVGCIIN